MRENNRYFSHYLVEHNPGEDKDPYDVYDMLRLFDGNADKFSVKSLSAAKELINKLDELERTGSR